MKKIYFLGLLLITLAACEKKQTPTYVKPVSKPYTMYIRVGTYNILNKNTDEHNSANFGGDIRRWANRKEAVAEVIKRKKLDVFGAQELGDQTMKNELSDLLPEYDYCSTTYQTPVFWLKDKYTLVKQGDFFAEPHRGWHCVWVKLKENKSGKQFYVFNGHAICCQWTEERIQYAQNLVANVPIINKQKLPAFLTADFNAFDEVDDTKTAHYNKYYGSIGFANFKNIARTKINEEYGTYALFTPPKKGTCWLDRIYVYPGIKEGMPEGSLVPDIGISVEVQRYEAALDWDPNRPGYLMEPIPSDHFLLFGDFVFSYKN